MPGRLVFSTTADGASSTTERMRITSDGYTRLASGSGGIQFNGDTAAANALDDYEEGTWTPSIANTGYTYTYAAQEGTYIKIGKQVTLRWRIVVTARSGSASGGAPIVAVPITTDGSLDAASTVNAQPAQLVVHKAGTTTSSGAQTLLYAGFANSATTYFWINNPTVTDASAFDLGADFYLSGVITYDAA